MAFLCVEKMYALGHIVAKVNDTKRDHAECSLKKKLFQLYRLVGFHRIWSASREINFRKYLQRPMPKLNSIQQFAYLNQFFMI